MKLGRLGLGLGLALALFLANAVVPTTAGKVIFKSDSTVHVINNLQPGSAPLRVHCQSKDTDLGMKEPGVGQEFHWTFKMNITYTTEFYCTFWWDNKRIQMDVYNKTLDRDGQVLSYSVTEAGINYKTETFTDWHLVHVWGPPN